MDLLTALALISADKAVRRQERKEEFWEDVFTRERYNKSFKFGKGTIMVIKVLLGLLGLVILYAYVS